MVAKFQQSNFNTDTATQYKSNLDADIAVLAELAGQFAVSAQDTPNLTVAMRAGRIYRADRTIIAVAAQNSSILTAPITNPRNDIVYVDATTGAIGVATGTEAASPADPAIPANKLPKARIRWTVGATQITNSMIDDLRFDPPSLDAVFAYLATAPLPIAQGGTGATTAAAARSSLGAAGVADSNTFSGSNAFTGNNTFTGSNAFTGNNTFTGPTIVNHILSKNASYTVTASDAGAEIQFAGLAAAATVTLPDGVTTGFSVIIADLGDTANAVTISRQTTSSLLADGSNLGVTTYTLSRGERVKCIYDGANWILIPNQPRVIGLPSGGDKGAGTVNVQNGLYDNNNRVVSASAPATQSAIGSGAVGQAQLKTGLQQQTGPIGAGILNINLTGGRYSLAYSMDDNTENAPYVAYVAAGYSSTASFNFTSSSHIYSFECRYIQASPPYDLGDGEIPLFIFALVDSAGNIMGVDVAHDPPWYYNGPNRVTGFVQKNGKLIGVRRKLRLPMSPTDAKTAADRVQIAAALANSPIDEVLVETPSDKNLDMPVVPHPFVHQDLTGKTVVLLDPVSPKMAKLLDLHDLQDPQTRVTDLLMNGYLQIGNTALKRAAPPGVMPVDVKWKLT
jgi:hypothetical protein